jgi:hypothetical protein
MCRLMDFHETASMKFTMGKGRPSKETSNRRDLDTTVARNLEDGGEFVMVRMFRRLLRTQSKSRVVGIWIF